MLPARPLIIICLLLILSSCTKKENVPISSAKPTTTATGNTSSSVTGATVVVPAYPHTDTFYGPYTEYSITGAYNTVYVTYQAADSIILFSYNYSSANVSFSTVITDTNKLKTAYVFYTNWGNGYQNYFSFTLGTVATLDTAHLFSNLSPQYPLLVSSYMIGTGGCDHGPTGSYIGYRLSAQ